jgi:FixJ family two-component response regulator
MQRLVARYESLTSKERELLPLLVSGLLNKQAAFELGITEYTVQFHRGHIMRKMRADSFAGWSGWQTSSAVSANRPLTRVELTV